MLQFEELLYAFDGLNTIIIVSDVDGRFLYVNDAFVSSYGYTRNIVIGEEINLIKSDYYDKLYYKNLWDTIKSGEIWSGVLLNKKENGDVIRTETKIIPVVKNGVVQKYIVFQEINADTQNTKTFLNEKQNLIDSIFCNSVIGIATVDLKGNYISVNNEFAKIHNAENPDILKGTRSQIYAYNKDSKTIVNNTKEYKRVDGTEFYGETIIIPIKESKNKIDSFLIFLIDVTEKHKQHLEQGKREAELLRQNQTKDRLLSIIAHDVKNPFSAIIGLSSLLNTGYEDFSKEEVKDFISRISESGENTFKLLEDLLLWAKSQLGELKINKGIVSVENVVSESITLTHSLAHTKRISVVNKCKSDDVVYIDEIMIKFIVRNLIHNAIKFSNSNSQIICSFINDYDDNYSAIKIRDFGIGIGSQFIDKLFNMGDFITVEGTDYEKGTGIGLSLSKEMLNLNDSDIFVESEVGKGTTFTIIIPK